MDENVLISEYQKLDQVYTMFGIGQIVLIVIAAIGIILVLYGFYKNSIDQKRNGMYVFIFGAIIYACFYLMEKKTTSNVNTLKNNPEQYYEEHFNK